MASRQDVADYLLDQLARLPEVRARRMFGEFGIYLGERFVALIADDQLFVKDTAPGRDFWPEAEEGIPFPGAKPWLLVPADQWEDPQWLCALLEVTASALAPVAARRKRGPRSRP